MLYQVPNEHVLTNKTYKSKPKLEFKTYIIFKSIHFTAEAYLKCHDIQCLYIKVLNHLHNFKETSVKDTKNFTKEEQQDG